MGTTEKLARFVVETSFEDIPSAVITVAKELNLDCLGATLAGSAHPVSKIATRLTREMGGSSEAGVVAGGFLTSAPNAAFANGVMAHVHDYDDTWLLPNGHPTSPIFSAILALGEKMRLPGKALLEAYVVGMEVHGKIGGLGYHKTGFHHTGIYGTMGAAAACAKLLKLDVGQTRMAFGIACSAASGMGRNHGTMTKSLHVGNAARGGMIAALLAREGWTADDSLLDGYRGFTDSFIGMESIPAPEPGQPYHLLSPGVAVKKYPCCYGAHRALDATLQLMSEHRILYGDVESVDIGISTPSFLNNPSPANGLEAKFSLQYCVGAAISSGKVARDSFLEEQVHSPEMREALQKVKLIVQPDIPLDYSHACNPVTLRLKDGRVYNRSVSSSEIKGAPETRLSREELLAKYRDNAQLTLGPRGIERTIELLLGLERVRDVSEIMELVVSAPAPTTWKSQGG